MRTILATLALIATPAFAADRNFTVTNFDTIRVQGPYRVTVTTGQAPSARASGPQRALDAVSVEVQSGALIIRRISTTAGGPIAGDGGAISIAVTAHNIDDARISGTGRLDIDAMQGARLLLGAEGASALAVARIDADRLDLLAGGSSLLRAAGRTADARVALRGAGTIDAAALTASDAAVALEGTGAVTLAVTRSARVEATGAGSVTITGGASCERKVTGSATVECGD
jgi:hypothetical protein